MMKKWSKSYPKQYKFIHTFNYDGLCCSHFYQIGCQMDYVAVLLSQSPAMIDKCQINEPFS